MKRCNSCEDKYDEMLPGYHHHEGGVVGHGCHHNSCHHGCGHKDHCGCPEPIQEAFQPEAKRPTLLRWNYGGHSVEYDFANMIRMGQTDTSLGTKPRALVYNAERHTDEISAETLGGILRLGDISDVDMSKVDDGSLLVYRKSDNCPDGCQGINNAWVGWNPYSEDNIETSMQTMMGFDAKGAALSLGTPLHPNQHYVLGWHGANKLSYEQPVVVSAPPVDAQNNAYRVYLDPTTKQLVTVKEAR